MKQRFLTFIFCLSFFVFLICPFSMADSLDSSDDVPLTKDRLFTNESPESPVTDVEVFPEGVAGESALCPDAEEASGFPASEAEAENNAAENPDEEVETGSPEETEESPVESLPLVEEKQYGISITMEEVRQEGITDCYKIGDAIVYRITVNNVGNVEINELALTDKNAVFDKSNAYTVLEDGHIATGKIELPPEAKAVFLASHILTESDLLNGKGAYSNTVTVSVSENEEEICSVKEELTVLVESPVTLLEISGKNIGLYGSSVCSPGEKAKYGITVVNTGNVTVKAISVKADGLFLDPTEGLQLSADRQAATSVISLSPGESLSLSAFTDLDETDLMNGSHDFMLSVVGKNCIGDEVTSSLQSSFVMCELQPDVSIEISEKSIPVKEIYHVGENIAYEICLKNTGNVTLSDIILQSDALFFITEDAQQSIDPHKFICPSSLPPASTVTVGAVHELTSSEVFDSDGVLKAEVSFFAKAASDAECIGSADIASPIAAKKDVIYSKIKIYAVPVLALVSIFALLLAGKKRHRADEISKTYQPDISQSADYFEISYLSGAKKNYTEIVSFKNSLIIGSEKDCDLVVTGRNISGKQARIYTNRDRLCIEDLDSDDGTFVNGSRIYSANRLRTDDLITIGSVSFKIVY